MTGQWSSVMPAAITDSIALPVHVRSVRIEAPEMAHLIGLIVPTRYAISPITNALVREAERLAQGNASLTARR
jgi:hypothetical protein